MDHTRIRTSVSVAVYLVVTHVAGIAGLYHVIQWHVILCILHLCQARYAYV
jgi:hypothetical protein